MAYTKSRRLARGFFERDVLEVAPALLGKYLCLQSTDGRTKQFCITETEAYRGMDDLACHASKGRTKRTDVMFCEAGLVYVYLIYGVHWMLNFVCNVEGVPQAALIRGLDGISGPGRVGKALAIDKSFYGEDLINSRRIWLEDGETIPFISTPRIGIEYAGEPWVGKPWRFLYKQT